MIAKKFTVKIIKGYQLFSSTREPRCKYYPSCSNYAATAIQRYGFKGLALSIWRLIRCNPWSDGGLDYVDYELDSAEAVNSITSGSITSGSIISSSATSSRGFQ